VFANHGTVYTVTSALGGPATISITPALTASVPNNTALTVQVRAFEFTQGPYPLRTDAERVVNLAIQKCFEQLRRVPRSVHAYVICAEDDLPQYATYQAALQRVLDWLNGLLSHRLEGETQLPMMIAELTSETGYPGTSDTAIAAIRQAQKDVAAQRANCLTVPTSDLPMEIGPAGVFPPQTREDNGRLPTTTGLMRLGHRIDYVSSLLPGVPAHPKGEDASVMPSGFGGGSSSGGASVAGADGGTDEGSGSESLSGSDDAVEAVDTEGTDTEEPVFIELVVEDGTAKSDAESYITVAEFREMARRIGNPTEISGATEEQIQVWLRKSARDGIDMIYTDALQGLRISTTQSLEWPRRGAADNRTQVKLDTNFIPPDWKRAQFWYAYALAFGIDPMEIIDHKDDDVRKRYTTAWSESLPGGLSESQTYGMGVPMRSIVPRMEMAARPFLLVGDDVAGAV